ncbi:transposase [Micromonospora sp. NPDC050417]|uniref:transposase n=1 Tax=Micromonospora sp. NPDC050417 TaxID=3364280 RepID=UPI0037B7ED88
MLESALDAELDVHLDGAGVDETTGRRTNVRNSHGAKTAQTEVGPVWVRVPRDRAGLFTPWRHGSGRSSPSSATSIRP